MKVRAFEKWLKSKGVKYQEGNKHTKYKDDRQSTLPRHAGEINEGLRNAIIKQLGLNHP